MTDTVVAHNCKGAIDIPRGSREAEDAFWIAVLSKAPSVVLENLEDVQTALHIGALLFAFSDNTPPSPRMVGFLAAVLTYRLPQLRGDADPFGSEYMPH
nr:hypothetical protein CFP56_09486 [Quercus suber]